ncbi:MAG: serine/threonine protein kinase [Firmicutes bacterium]|nr:serine/threonine protein kinase [Bacillota bacterium]
MLKTEELLLNRYRVIEQLGRGGFADVYRAFDTRMEREVAIKHMHIKRHSADRMLREARTVALLNHPNIVTVHEFEEDGDDCYLIMELLEGVPLSKILSRIAPLEPKEAIAIAIEICRALEVAHLNGIVHRDIKPENVMILFDGRLKVMDFGIAHLKGAASTTSDDVIGTFAYMSPEQARGDTVDERSDIYSLGTVLYELLTDCIPFSGESVAETLNMVQHLQPFPPSSINPALDEYVDACVMTALAKNGHERYQSAAEFRENLEYLRAPGETAERVLLNLINRYLNLDAESAQVTDTNWRSRFWRFIEEHKESITRTPAALVLGAPFLPILRYWYGIPRSIALFGATAVYLVVLLRPDYGVGIAFLFLSLSVIKYSLGLFFIMFLLLLPYWFLVGKRFPIISVSPVAGAAFGIIQVPFIFPVLVGLLVNPIAAAIIAGLGCLAFEFMNIALNESTAPELVKAYNLWAMIRGQSNPINIIQLLSGPFIEDKLLLLQPVLWAIVAATASAVGGKRRWFFGTLAGFTVLFMGYQGLLTNISGRAHEMGRLMQSLSFSLIILLLLPIFRPPAKVVEAEPGPTEIAE